ATLHLRNIDLWSPDTPHLYLVRAILQDSSGNARDDLVEIAGFRRIEQRQGRLFLNGRPWFMKSFGENLGFAPGFNFMGEVCMPDEWILRDFVLAKKANANAIRVHPWGFTGDVGNYTDMAWPVWGMPNSSTNYQRIAWIADQLGIGLVWGTRLWTLWGSDFRNKYSDDTWQARLEPSLRHVRNRASVLVYEGLNEVSLLRARSYKRFCQRYLEFVNRIDDSRLVLPDTPWGPLEYSPFPKNSYTVVHAAPFLSPGLYNSVENTFWTDHNYFGWYKNLPEQPLLDKAQARPFVLNESGAEAMPDWRLYRGMRWNGNLAEQWAPLRQNRGGTLGKTTQDLAGQRGEYIAGQPGIKHSPNSFCNAILSG
ncbi:MAG: hypothetical protein HY508_16035, partial [Acidobacteria bacterium]|nr:hypothetical protein [Acidobacteriota bacterium]